MCHMIYFLWNYLFILQKSKLMNTEQSAQNPHFLTFIQNKSHPNQLTESVTGINLNTV